MFWLIHLKAVISLLYAQCQPISKLMELGQFSTSAVLCRVMIVKIMGRIQPLYLRMCQYELLIANLSIKMYNNLLVIQKMTYFWLFIAILVNTARGQVTTVCASYGDIQKVSYTLPTGLKTYDFFFTDNREQILGIGFCTANDAGVALRFHTLKIKYKINGSGAF